MILNLKPCLPTNFYLPFLTIIHATWLRSAVGNVSDCRSRGHKFYTARANTFEEIDHEIVSSVILLRLAQIVQEGLLPVTSESICMKCWLGKSVVRFTERPAMTIAVELGRKATKKLQSLTIKITSLTHNTITNLPSLFMYNLFCNKLLDMFNGHERADFFQDLCVISCIRTVGDRIIQRCCRLDNFIFQ